jgi:hypothetical protein
MLAASKFPTAAAAAADDGAAAPAAARAKAPLLSKVDLSCLASDDSTTSGPLIPAFREVEPDAAAGSASPSPAAAAAEDGATAPAAAKAAAAVPAAAPAADAKAPATPRTPARGEAAPRQRSKARLLALCPTVPPSMQRDVWCIADYEILEKLYTGYASKGGSRLGSRLGRRPARPAPGSPGRRRHARGGRRQPLQARSGAAQRARPCLTSPCPASRAPRPAPRSPTPCPAVYKAICKRTREVVVLKSYQMSAICELYQHQIYRWGGPRGLGLGLCGQVAGRVRARA